MTKSIYINVLCVMLMCVVCAFVFSACGGKNYTYKEFQDAFSQYVSSNSYSDENVNAIFDESGNVKVNYSNSGLKEAINCKTVEDYKLMFTRLSSDTSSEQALFEPALKSSLLMVQKYISVEPVKTIPTESANLLMEKLATLDDKTDAFEFNLVIFQTRGSDFNKNGNIDKNFLNKLLNSYYDLLVASCDLGNTFSDIANTYFWNDVADSKTGRIAPGKIERYYLTQLTSLVDTYVRFDLATFYGQSAVISGEEYFTSKDPAGKINEMLATYETNKDKLSEFESRYNKEGVINTSEWHIINSYRNAVDYDTTYLSAYNMASKSLDKMGNKAVDLDEKYDAGSATQAHRKIVENFVQNEFNNKLNMMLNLINYVQEVV